MANNHEKIRAEIARKYNNTIKTLEAENKKLKEENFALSEELSKAKAELLSKSEWIERMQDFCNMADEDRDALIKGEVEKKELHEALNLLAVGMGKNFLSDLF